MAIKVATQMTKGVTMIRNFLIRWEIYSYAFAFIRFEATHQKPLVMPLAMHEKSKYLTTASILLSSVWDVASLDSLSVNLC